MNIYQKIFNEIKKHNKIIILTHVRSDGDCVGSAIGLKEMIKAMYPKKTVLASYEGIDYLPFLAKGDRIEDDDFKDVLVISVDNANLDRSNDIRIKDSQKVIKIDHHPNREPFGYINFVDENKCACAEIIFDFLCHVRNAKTSLEGLEALCTGIMTDSGKLTYSSVSGDTYKKVGLMVDMGVDRKKIIDAMEKVTLNELKFKGFVFENMKTTEHGVLYIKITPKDREKYNIEYNDASNMVNELALVEGYPVWALFNEYKEDEVRARVRSSGLSINEVCERFNGGGHKNASGIVLKSWDDADKVIEALDQEIKNNL